MGNGSEWVIRRLKYVPSPAYDLDDRISIRISRSCSGPQSNDPQNGMRRVGWLRKLFGDRGESIARSYLRRKGYRIIARQSRSFIGEIDLIALDRDTIVFVEVKTRASHAAGHPAEAVHRAKQQQLTRAALVWLKRRRLLSHRCRFDVIAITWKDQAAPLIEHFEHAFEAAGQGQMWS